MSDFLPWASPFEGNFSDRCGVELLSTGRLLAFYFDGSYDDFASIVGTWDRTTLAGARLVHVAEPRSTCAPLAPPDRVPEFGAEDWDVDAWRAHPTQRDAFNEALFALDEGDAPRHQIGGWADPVQGPVELEVAQAAMPEELAYGDTAHLAEAAAWRPLLQVDSDDTSQMMWGDVGMLYWLRRTSGGDPRDLEPVSFTWQCG